MRREIESAVLENVNNWNKQTLNGDYQPFKITLNFRVGRNGNDVIAFDSVISHYCMMHVLQSEFYNLSYDHDELIPLRIPLAKIQYENDFFYICGWLPGIPEKTAFWTKRFEKQIVESVTNTKVSVRQGQFKSYKMPTLYDDKKQYVIWGKGDIDMIREVLPNPFHVGKKAAIGFGECEYTIEKVDRSNGLMFHNFLQRPLPMKFVDEKGWKIENGNIVSRPIAPPYFGEKARKHICYDVGSKLYADR